MSTPIEKHPNTPAAKVALLAHHFESPGAGLGAVLGAIHCGDGLFGKCRLVVGHMP